MPGEIVAVESGLVCLRCDGGSCPGGRRLTHPRPPSPRQGLRPSHAVPLLLWPVLIPYEAERAPRAARGDARSGHGGHPPLSPLPLHGAPSEPPASPRRHARRQRARLLALPLPDRQPRPAGPPHAHQACPRAPRPRSRPPVPPLRLLHRPAASARPPRPLPRPAPRARARAPGLHLPVRAVPLPHWTETPVRLNRPWENDTRQSILFLKPLNFVHAVRVKKQR